MMGERLPEGWEWKKLGELGKIESGGTPRRGKQEYWKGGSIPWVKISDISDKHILKTSEKITKEGLENSSAKIFSKGSLLISIFATLGDVGILNIDAACNQALASIQLNNNNVDRDYLYYLLKSLKKHFEKIGRGVAQNNINLTILKSTKIPLPPLETQRKIVAILEKADETKRLRMQADGLTTQLLQSVFLEMFGDPVKNPNGWEMKTMDEVCDRITDGEHVTPKRTNEGIYLLSARNIRNHKLALDDVDFIGEEEYEKISRRIAPQKGDVLISCSGTIGRVARVKENFKFQLVRSVALVRPRIAIVHPIYLEYGFGTNLMKSQIERAVNQSSQANLFQGKIRKLSIPIPPMFLQQKFAQIVEKVEAMRQNQKQSQQEIDNLFNALMQKAFKGELVA